MAVQVYKGRLRETGEVVAIKVQRPGVLEGISRDLYLLRVAATALQKLPQLDTDVIALLDTWALRFFDELDYIQEVLYSLSESIISRGVCFL